MPTTTLRRTALITILTLSATACAGQAGRSQNASPGNPAAAAAVSSEATSPTASPPGTPSNPPPSGTAALAASRPPATRVGTVPAGSAAAPAGSLLTNVPVTKAGASTDPLPGPSAAADTRTGTLDHSSNGARTGSGPIASGTTTTGVTADSITIGVFYPRTGAYAGLFRNTAAVVQAAFDEAGRINGRRLVLKTYDDGTADAATIQVEEKRAKEETFTLVSMISESNVVLAPLADRHRIPLVIGNVDEKVVLPLTYAFPVWPFWARQAQILPGFIQNVLGGGNRRIGVVFEGTSTAIDAKEAFKAKARELGLHVVYEQPIAQNQSACANEAANLQAHQVDLVFMMNGPLGAICMLRDARALSYHPTWTGVGDSWNINAVALASGGAADGVKMLTGFSTLDTPAGRHFSEVMRRYAPNSGAEGDDAMLAYYGIIETVLEGLRRAGPDLSREGLVRTFETAMNGFDSGYLPPPTFGPGIRSGPLAVGVVSCCTSGRWTTIQQGWRTSF